VRGDLIQRLRIAWFRRRWNCAQIDGEPQLRAPALLAGKGRISFGDGVILGWEQSAGYLSGYTYIEARGPDSRITFGDLTHLNNGVMVVSEGPGISLGRRCLIGPGVHVYDSDFHPLVAADRHDAAPRMARVEIGDDVFVGTNALILKGVTVGDGAVVAAGAVVVADVPAGAVVAGNPARVIGG
jgi:acetyltransferase-like isoleucine patch superfamily enzyme